MVKNLPPHAGNVRDADSIPGSGRPLEKETTNHSNILTWRTPWTVEPGRLQSTRSQSVRYHLSNLAHAHVNLKSRKM